MTYLLSLRVASSSSFIDSPSLATTVSNHTALVLGALCFLTLNQSNTSFSFSSFYLDDLWRRLARWLASMHLLLTFRHNISTFTFLHFLQVIYSVYIIYYICRFSLPFWSLFIVSMVSIVQCTQTFHSSLGTSTVIIETRSTLVQKPSFGESKWIYFLPQPNIRVCVCVWPSTNGESHDHCLTLVWSSNRLTCTKKEKAAKSSHHLCVHSPRLTMPCSLELISPPVQFNEFAPKKIAQTWLAFCFFCLVHCETDNFVVVVIIGKQAVWDKLYFIILCDNDCVCEFF